MKTNQSSDQKSLRIGPQKRAISVPTASAKVDRESRTITFPFSSELGVERWFGKEILSHEQGAMDLSRLNDGGQLLFNHDMDDYRGVVEKAYLGADRRCYAMARFGKSPEADQLMQDVDDGIIRNVSFMYQVNEMVLSKKDDDGACEYTATSWTPFEVSFVTIPADPTVGVGRSNFDNQNQNCLEIPIKNVADEPEGETMRFQKRMLLDKAGEGQGAGGGGQPTINVDQVRADAQKQARENMIAIMALGERFKKPELARQLIEGGKSLDEARGAFLESMGMTQKPVAGNEADVGLSEKEVRQFSFMKAIRAMMEPTNARAQEDAGFEREVSRATEKKNNTTARGFLIPFDVLRAPLTVDGKVARNLVVGTGTAGGDLVATNLLAASFIDLLRNKSALQQCGVTVLNGLSSNISIPRQTGAATAYWVGEGVAPTSETDQSFDQVTMSPKTIGAYTDYSRKLLLQSSLDIEALIRNDLALVMALGIDLAGLYGTGSSNQPLGLKNTSGIATKDFAASAPTWAEIVDMETKVATANADIGAMKYLANALGRGQFKTTAKVSNFPQYIMADDGSVNGYPCAISNQVATSGSDFDVWFGVWSQLMIGYWSGLDILVDPYTGGKEGNIRVIAHQDCDVAARQAPAFVRGNNNL